MKNQIASLGVLAGLALLSAGCQSNGIATRIQEKSALYESLKPEVQQDLQQGTIAPGYTADMVYIALGTPSAVKIRDTAQGKVGAWIYRNFYPADYEAREGQTAEPPPIATSSFTRPGTSDYGFVQTEDPQISLFAKGRTFGRVKIEVANSSTFSTRSGEMQPLDLPDMESASLCVIFHRGRVTQIYMGKY